MLSILHVYYILGELVVSFINWQRCIFRNHECPACRKHCASRRSLRPDPKFDAFIAATFGNVDSNEEQVNDEASTLFYFSPFKLF